ncbi:MAG: hypothetical protein ABFD64_05060 [Armatimonadota bacterium]
MEKTENAPYLPALESVRTAKSFRAAARRHALISVALLICLLFFPLMILVVAISTGTKHPKFSITVAGLMLIISIGIIVWFFNTIRADFYWETSPRGILIKGLFRCRLIEWTQIREVISTQSFVLLTDIGELKLSAVPDQVLVTFGASIWQHLAEINSPASFKPTPQMKSLWMEIPADTPHEVDWVNPRLPRITMKDLPILLPWSITFVILCVFIIILGIRGLWYQWLFLIGPGMWIYMLYIWPMRKTARQVSVREDALSVEIANKTVVFDWSDMGFVNWNTSLWGYALYIKNGKKEVMIPFDESQDASTDKLILSIIRRLREADPPILMPIPDPLQDRMQDSAIS